MHGLFWKLLAIMYASNSWRERSFNSRGIACSEALSLADDLLLHNFLVATDSKQVANDINMGCTGIHGLIVAEIKLRTTKFNCSFCF